MDLKERVYSVLIVSASAAFNRSLIALLPESGQGEVTVATDISEAGRMTAERSFDFIIVNSPLASDTGIRFAIDRSREKQTVVLLMVRAEAVEEIHGRVGGYGVYTLAKPTSKNAMLTALSWMACTRERLRQNEKKTLSIEEKMEEIRMVNRAKWLLIRELKMDEPTAHRHIEKQAMDRCVTRREIAEEIIRMYT